MNAPVSTAPKHKSQRSTSSNTVTVRVAYPFFHKRRTQNGKGKPLANPRFDGSFLFPKLHADPTQDANYLWLWAHACEAARKAWPGSVDTTGQWVWPAGGHFSIQDGDKPYAPKPAAPGQPVVPVDPNKYAWRRGNWIVEATHMLDPGPKISVMSNGVATDIPAQTVNGQQMYKSGDYAIVHMHAYTFENEKFGVNFGFEGVLFVGEGEAIGSSGGRSTAQMFGNVPGTPGMGTHVAPPGGYAAPALPPAAPQPNPTLVIPSVQHLPPGQVAAPLPPAASPPIAPPAPSPGVVMPPAALPAFPRPA